MVIIGGVDGRGAGWGCWGRWVDALVLVLVLLLGGGGGMGGGGVIMVLV